MLARDKPSGLLLTLVNYGRKRFYMIGPWDAKHGGVGWLRLVSGFVLFRLLLLLQLLVSTA